MSDVEQYGRQHFFKHPFLSVTGSNPVVGDNIFFFFHFLHFSFLFRNYIAKKNSKNTTKKICLPVLGSNLQHSEVGVFTEAASSLSEKKTQQLKKANFGAQLFYASRFLLCDNFENNLCHLIADIMYYLCPNEQKISKNGATLILHSSLRTLECLVPL